MVNPKLVSSSQIDRIVNYASSAKKFTTDENQGGRININCGYLHAIGDRNDHVTYKEFLTELKTLKASKDLYSAANRETLNEINQLIPVFQREIQKGQGQKSLIDLERNYCGYVIRDIFRR